MSQMKKNRGRLFGYIYFSAISAYVIGPLVGGKLADPSLISWFSYSTPFWAVFFLLILTSIWTYFSFQETHLPEEGEQIHYLQAFTNLKNVFLKSDIRILYLINFLIYIVIYGFFRSYPMYIVGHFHLNVSRASEFIAWVAVPIIISNMWLTGILIKKDLSKNPSILHSDPDGDIYAQHSYFSLDPRIMGHSLSYCFGLGSLPSFPLLQCFLFPFPMKCKEEFWETTRLSP